MLADFNSHAIKTKTKKTLCVREYRVIKFSDDKADRRQQQWFVGHGPLSGKS